MAAASLTEKGNPPFSAPMPPHVSASRNIAAGHSPCARGLENSCSIAVDTRLADDELSGAISPDMLDTVGACVSDALEAEQYKINPVSHQNLVVHIAIAIARIRKECYVPMEAAHLEHVRGTREYAVAGTVAGEIELRFDIDLPEEEIAYIAIHLASKHLVEGGSPPHLQDASDENLEITDEAWNLAADMIETVWRAFRFDFRNDAELRMNLARHTMPLIVRLRYNMAYTFQPIVDNLMLQVIFGGFLYGFAIAVALRGGASTAGTDFISLMVSNKTGQSIWGLIFAGNCAVLLIFGALFGWEAAAYSIIFQFISTKAIEMFYTRYDRVTLQITTTRPEQTLADYNEIHKHGSSVVEVMGGRSRKRYWLITTVVSSYEIDDIMHLIRVHDGSAVVNVFRTETFFGNFYRAPID